jgi:hypothetical protein
MVRPQLHRCIADRSFVFVGRVVMLRHISGMLALRFVSLS